MKDRNMRNFLFILTESIMSCLCANEKDVAERGGSLGGMGNIRVEKPLDSSERRDTVPQETGWL